MDDSENRLTVSETYLIGVDINKDMEQSVVAVGRLEIGKNNIIKTFYGKEAIEFYKILKGDFYETGTNEDGNN